MCLDNEISQEFYPGCPELSRQSVIDKHIKNSFSNLQTESGLGCTETTQKRFILSVRHSFLPATATTGRRGRALARPVPNSFAARQKMKLALARAATDARRPTAAPAPLKPHSLKVKVKGQTNELLPRVAINDK